MTKTTQERIAAFPAAIVVDLDGLACATRFGIVTPGEPGYAPLYGRDGWSLDRLDAVLIRTGRADRAPTAFEREAALVGSMFGWHVPGADPAVCEREGLTNGAGA